MWSLDNKMIALLNPLIEPKMDPQNIKEGRDKLLLVTLLLNKQNKKPKKVAEKVIDTIIVEEIKHTEQVFHNEAVDRGLGSFDYYLMKFEDFYEDQD